MKPARIPTGSAFESKGRFYAKVTTATKVRPALALPWCNTLPDAFERAHVLQGLINDLHAAGQSYLVDTVVAKGGTADAAMLAELRSLVVAGKIAPIPVAGKDGPETFATFGEKWTNGDLHTSYPDDIPEKKSKDTDEHRLEILYRTIGPVPLVRFTLQDAQRAMRALPLTLQPNTRRHYAQLIHRVLAMAAYPACIIPSSPLPKGFVGKPGKEKAKALPWPSEDAAGLACATWPLAERMLFGFLPREGMRTSEAARLTWGDLDLKVGAVRLDENKTDDPRAWALDPSVAKALAAWKKMRTDAKATDLVFKRADGTAYDTDKIAPLYRSYLETACNARAEILAKQAPGSNRLRVRAHDMRGAFVTYSMAAGRNESWVQDRTGHTTSAMLNRYRRTARTVAELGLGALRPLAEAIPEVASVESADPPLSETPDPPRADTKSVSKVSAEGVQSDELLRAKVLKVHGRGLEPLRLSAVEPKSTASAIPPPVHV